MERVSVNLDVGADRQIRRRDESHVLVNILVLSLMQELTLNNARVFLSRLVDAEVIIRQVERDDKTSVKVLRDASVESGGKAEDASRVVHSLEEVAFRLLGHKAEGLALGVLFVTKAVVGWVLTNRLLLRHIELHGAEREIVLVALAVETLRELIDALNLIDSTVGIDARGGSDLVASQEVVADEAMTGLVHIDTIGKLLAAEVDGETISAVVSLVTLADLECVVTEVVVDNEGEILTLAEEAQNLAIVVQELLLVVDLATTELLLKELEKLGVLLLRLGLA